MVELERAVVAWQQEGTPEAQGAVVWRAAQVLWETAALFKRHAGSPPCALPMFGTATPPCFAEQDCSSSDSGPLGSENTS